MALFDKSKSREKEVPEASGFQGNCQAVAGYGQGFFRQTVFLFGAMLSLDDSFVCVVLVGCVVNSGTSETFGQGRMALLAELPTLCTFISV